MFKGKINQHLEFGCCANTETLSHSFQDLATCGFKIGFPKILVWHVHPSTIPSLLHSGVQGRTEGLGHTADDAELLENTGYHLVPAEIHGGFLEGIPLSLHGLFHGKSSESMDDLEVPWGTPMNQETSTFFSSRIPSSIFGNPPGHPGIIIGAHPNQIESRRFSTTKTTRPGLPTTQRSLSPCCAKASCIDVRSLKRDGA